jgi:hypothetical protein
MNYLWPVVFLKRGLLSGGTIAGYGVHQLMLSSGTARGGLTQKLPSWRRCDGNSSTWMPTMSHG